MFRNLKYLITIKVSYLGSCSKSANVGIDSLGKVFKG